LLAVRVYAGDAQDRDGGKPPLQLSRRCYSVDARIFADGGYAGRLLQPTINKIHIILKTIHFCRVGPAGWFSSRS
jgi:hypothetical protein